MNNNRSATVRSTVQKIQEIEENHGATRESLNMIKDELLNLAANSEWFTTEEFPPPCEDNKDKSCVYRLFEDEKTNRCALYIQTAIAPLDVPAHNHGTWAVIVGIDGGELNRFYDRTEDGVTQTGSHLVEPGSGVAMLPDDLHSIHVHDEDPVINFHLYGLGLEYLYDREYFDDRKQQWRAFPIFDEIVDARYVSA